MRQGGPEGRSVVRVRSEIFRRGAEPEDEGALGISMAIYVTLDRVLERRGITPTELSERVGMTLANLSIL